MFFFFCFFVTLKSGMIWWWSGNCFSPQHNVKTWIRSCLTIVSDVPVYRGGCQDFTMGTLVFHPIFTIAPYTTPSSDIAKSLYGGSTFLPINQPAWKCCNKKNYATTTSHPFTLCLKDLLIFSFHLLIFVIMSQILPFIYLLTGWSARKRKAWPRKASEWTEGQMWPDWEEGSRTKAGGGEKAYRRNSVLETDQSTIEGTDLTREQKWY